MGSRLVVPPSTRGSGAAGQGNDRPDDYFSRVAKYVPSEILAAYLTVDGIVKSVDPEKEKLLPWMALVVLVIFLALVPIYLNAFASPGQRKGLHMIVSSFGFVVWAYALGGVFTLWGLYVPWLASIILVLFTLVSGLLTPQATDPQAARR